MSNASCNRLQLIKKYIPARPRLIPFWLKPFWLNFWPLGASVQEQRVIDQRVKDPKGQGPIGPRVQRANSPKGHRVFLGHWERWSRTNVSRTQMVRWRTGQRSQGGGGATEWASGMSLRASVWELRFNPQGQGPNGLMFRRAEGPKGQRPLVL